LEKDGCIKASVTEKYTGSRDGEDLQSLENAANTAVKKMMGQLVSQFARVRNAGLVSRQGSTVAAPSQVLIKPATPDRREVESPVQAVQQAGDVRDLASMMSGVSVDQWPFAFSREQVKKLQYMHASFDGEILRVAEHMKYRDFTAEDFFRAYETWKTSGQKRVENIEMIAVLNHIGVNLRNIDLNTPLTTKYYNEKIVGGKVLRDTGLGLFIGLSAASLVVLIGLTTGINPEVGSILWSMSDIPTTALIMLTVATPCYVVGYNRMKTWLPDGTLENTPKYGLDKLKAASLGKASGLSIGVAPFFDGKTGGLSLGGTF
jgi:hypothetical protein